jgi:YVTN family beta-propeller protein
VIEFGVLGPVEAVNADGPLLLGGPQQRALLAVLLLHRGELVSADLLIEGIWGEQAPATAPKIVHGYVSSLRKVLGEGLLETRGHGYVLLTQPGQVDADRFESLVADGDAAFRAGDATTAADCLGAALSLWHGPALAEFAYSSFAQVAIAQLEEARMVATERLLDAKLELGRDAELLPQLEALVREHPLRERLVGQLMLAQYRSGRQADALSTYRHARTRLIDELGLEPGPELQKLEASVLAQDPALASPEPRARPANGNGVAARARTVQRRGAALIVVGATTLLAAVGAVIAVLVSSGSGGVTVQAAPNSVAAIDPHGDRVAGVAAVGVRPSAIAYGANSLWVANLDDQTVSQIDARTLQTEHTFEFAYPPSGIATAKGDVWVVGSKPTQKSLSVDRINPQFGSVTAVDRVATVGPGSADTEGGTGNAGSVASQGGSVWVAPASGALTRISSPTGHRIAQLDPDAQPNAIATGAGAAWIADSEANNVDRVDPSGLVSPIPVGNGPSAIAVGDGAVWVADAGDDQVVRINPGTRAPETTIHVGHDPVGIATGDGSVWVADSGNGDVSRIDPETNRVIAVIHVGGSPQQLTVAAGRVWVTLDAASVNAAEPADLADTLRIDYGGDVSPMDPAVVEDPLAIQLLYETCAKLFNYPDRDGTAGTKLIPEVAAGPPVRSHDGRTNRFTIRPGFRFSPPSNQAVTAQDFKYELERVLSPHMKSLYAPDYGNIVGARAFSQGRSGDLTGVTVQGDKLTIRLVTPAANLPALLAQPQMCAVPPDTPMDPAGVRVISSAGPYRIASFAPGQGVVLTLNPAYKGDRPHRSARIDVAVDVPIKRAIANVESGRADLLPYSSYTAAEVLEFERGYGRVSAASRNGHQQYFVSATPELDFFAFNTHRALFKSARLRRAVNYALDRVALAKLGDYFVPLPERPATHYLPPEIPGYSKTQVYPLSPDLSRARKLASGYQRSKVVLYTCSAYPCPEQAEIVRTDLAAIGLRVQVRTFGTDSLFDLESKRDPQFDMAWAGWIPDAIDPASLFDTLLETDEAVPTFVDPAVRRELDTANQLTGVKRSNAYAHLDRQIALRQAPLAAFGNIYWRWFLSARTGCEKFGVYGVDLGALCNRN